MEEIVETACRICQAGCGIKVHVKNGIMLKVEGSADNPITQGALCAKGLSATQLVYSPGRLKYPLRRSGKKGAGKWKRFSWNDALDLISKKLSEIKEKYGAEAVGIFKSQGSDWGNLWEYVPRFMNTFGSPNVFTSGHLCHMPRVIAGSCTYGVGTLNSDFENSKCIVLWAANPSGGNSGGLFIGKIMKARDRGAKIIVVDPILSPIASKADLWLQIRPQTDAALALGMINFIIKEKLYDKQFVEKWTEGFSKLKEHVAAYTVEKVEKITSIKADIIKDAAKSYATNRPSCIYDGNGIDQMTNSVQTARALCILRSIIGNIDITGGDLIPNTIETIPLGLNDQKQKNVNPIGKSYPLMLQFGNIPGQCLIDSIMTKKPYPIRALMVQGGNPMVSLANASKVKEALSGLELLVVMDLFMTRTAELADVVLPAASSFEKTGLTANPSLTSNYVVLQRKVIEPIGESWPDWKFWFELAKKLGYSKEFPWNDVEEAIDAQIKPSGLTVAQLKDGPVSLPRKYEKFKKNGFNTPSGRIQIYSKVLEDHGYDPLPSYVEPDETPLSRPDLAEEYPIQAICWPRDVYVHTQHRNIPWLRMLDPQPSVKIHPNDAAERKILDGETVTIKSQRGKVRVKAQITRRTPQGVVALVWGWGQACPEADLNLLTDDSKKDKIAGSTSNRLFLCQIEK
jgi:anaerobic selenocysteine-containing dehydrogenase